MSAATPPGGVCGHRKAKCAKPVQADSGTGVRHHQIGDGIHSRLLPLQHASEHGDGAH
jgi:hypothetical protein